MIEHTEIAADELEAVMRMLLAERGATVLLVAFGSLLVQLHRMLFGEAVPGVVRGERAGVSVGLLTIPVILAVWIGVSMPAALQVLLSQAAAVVRP